MALREPQTIRVPAQTTMDDRLTGGPDLAPSASITRRADSQCREARNGAMAELAGRRFAV